jgi:hypothetical protein
MMDSTLDNAIREAAARVRVETEGKLQPLLNAHRIVGDLLLRLVHQGAFEASSPTEDQSQRLSLTAGLIQSVSVSNDLIVRVLFGAPLPCFANKWKLWRG